MPKLIGATSKIPAEVIEGQFIRLEPLDIDAHAQELYEAGHAEGRDKLVWAHTTSYGPVNNVEAWKALARQRRDELGWAQFCVVDKASGARIGIINYLKEEPENRRTEIGGIWYRPDFWRTYANTETCYLLIKNAIEKYKYRRVEWTTDSKNERSRNAALRLGFTFEGILRNHRITIHGENRDTPMFSIIDSEWEDVKAKLEERLYGKSNGAQQ